MIAIGSSIALKITWYQMGNMARRLQPSFRVSRQIAATVYGVVSGSKYLEGVLTSLSDWLKPPELSPLKRALGEFVFDMKDASIHR